MIFHRRRRPSLLNLKRLQVLRNPAIGMMQTAKNGVAGDLAFGLCRPVNRRILFKRHVRSADIIVVVDVVIQHACQMLFVQDNDMVETFPPKRINTICYIDGQGLG